MFDPSVAPVIPQRTSARTALNSKPKQRLRRCSLPLASQHDVKRRTSNHVVVKPASTEVISSLIETLSAISTPAEHHFDSLSSIASSHSTSASPRPWQAESPFITGPTSRALQEDSRQPSPRTDSDGRKRSHILHDNYSLHTNRSSVRGGSPTRISSDRSYREDVNEPLDLYGSAGGYSIGNLSIVPKPSITTTISDISDDRRSLYSFTNSRLGLQASRDSLREYRRLVALTPRAEGKPTREKFRRGNTTAGSLEPDAIVVPKRGMRSNVAPEPPNIPTRASSVQSNGSPGRLNRDPEGTHGETSGNKKKHSIPNEDYIPTRNSSMRHSLRLSPSRHKRKSQQSESSSSMDYNKSLIGNQPENSEQTLQEVSGELEEDSVNRRIKELKHRKLERERSPMEFSTELFSAPQTPDRNLAPSPSQAVTLTTPTCAVVQKHANNAVEVHQIELLGDAEKGAPAPAIAQRIDRDDVVRDSSVDAKSATGTDSSAMSKDVRKRSSLALPTRSNSRLLKRFSRSMSPAPAEERRTLSNNFLDTKRITSRQVDETDLIDGAVDQYLLSSRLSQKISDPQTGRIISFSEVGDPEGSVVFCCVGMGLTRFIMAFYDELAFTLKLRLITPDRPGVGGSESHMDGLDTPLGWPDDVRAICQHLNITKFSLLAHSAGSIYALATALRMPQHIRCRVHLLAPWIPPSQMTTVGQQELSPARSLPYSQRLLRSLPMTFLKAANSNLLSATSASVTTSLPKSPRRSKRKSFVWSGAAAPGIQDVANGGDRDDAVIPEARNSEMTNFCVENWPPNRSVSRPVTARLTAQVRKEQRTVYDARLTEAIWDVATTGTNPAVDLLVCLERRQPIGFQYVDITRSVVIHHGSKDSRVPVENVKWLGRMMRRCEVRVLEGEGHGLMASAGVMGNVLTEMAQEWSDWNRVVRGKGGMNRRVTSTV